MEHTMKGFVQFVSADEEGGGRGTLRQTVELSL